MVEWGSNRGLAPPPWYRMPGRALVGCVPKCDSVCVCPRTLTQNTLANYTTKYLKGHTKRNTRGLNPNIVRLNYTQLTFKSHDHKRYASDVQQAISKKI